MVVDSLLQVTIILMHHAYASTPLEMEISILDNNGSIQNPSRSSLSLSKPFDFFGKDRNRPREIG
jgi:hypothetical protein